MPDPNQGLWTHRRKSPLSGRGPDDYHLSWTDLGQPIAGWRGMDPISVLHANKLFDKAFAVGSGGWNPNTHGSGWATGYADVYRQMFAGLEPINDVSGYNPGITLGNYWGGLFPNAPSNESLPEFAYSDVLPDVWSNAGFGDQYTQAYRDELTSAKDAAARDMRFNYLRRGMSGQAVDDYIRQQVNRIYGQNTQPEASDITNWLNAGAAEDYGEYQAAYAANQPDTLSQAPSGSYTTQRNNPAVEAFWNRATEPTTALANQHYSQGPGDPDFSGANLGDLFASVINKYPPASRRRQLSNPPAVPEDVLDAEISTYFNLETTPQQAAHKGKVVK